MKKAILAVLLLILLSVISIRFYQNHKTAPNMTVKTVLSAEGQIAIRVVFREQKKKFNFSIYFAKRSGVNNIGNNYSQEHFPVLLSSSPALYESIDLLSVQTGVLDEKGLNFPKFSFACSFQLQNGYGSYSSIPDVILPDELNATAVFSLASRKTSNPNKLLLWNFSTLNGSYDLFLEISYPEIE
mgnify:CR=1 FL=1